MTTNDAGSAPLERTVGRLEPERASACGLTECRGKPMCNRCAHQEIIPMTEGELWSWVRNVMSQGADIRLDYDHGTHKTYEHYSARLDAAAAERAGELWARLKTPNCGLSRTSQL